MASNWLNLTIVTQGNTEYYSLRVPDITDYKLISQNTNIFLESYNSSSKQFTFTFFIQRLISFLFCFPVWFLNKNICLWFVREQIFHCGMNLIFKHVSIKKQRKNPSWQCVYRQIFFHSLLTIFTDTVLKSFSYSCSVSVINIQRLFTNLLHVQDSWYKSK